jgi:hypothetical protein
MDKKLKKVPHVNYFGVVEFSYIDPYKMEGENSQQFTHLQGEISVTWKEIVKTFGKPNDDTDGYKVDAHWSIMTPAGAATIYNYKDGKNYLGKEGTPKTKITDWHIGGHKKDVVAYILLAILVNKNISTT